MIDLDQLESLAHGATQGPREVVGGGEFLLPLCLGIGNPHNEDAALFSRDADFLVATGPDEVLELVSAARMLEAVKAEAATHDAGRGGCVCPLCRIVFPKPTTVEAEAGAWSPSTMIHLPTSAHMASGSRNNRTRARGV